MIGSQIALCHKACGLSQTELGRRLGLSASAVGMYELGRREPSCNILIALSREFDVTIEYLLTDETVSRIPYLQTETLSKEDILEFLIS